MAAFAEISAGKRRRHPKLEGHQDRVAVAGVHGEEDLESVQVQSQQTLAAVVV